MKMGRKEMGDVRRLLAKHWGLSQAQVHVGTTGRVVIDKATDKTPAEHETGIMFYDDEELYCYLEQQGLA